ncbi:MAG TPA: flagellar hook-basal body complex protein FliE [Firmicutes bacterium]|jgi:flagellar hook-basal body complex protein FliE|nr:flagellar hook-basal body complex protein FliE [Bacillota bacterium]
MEIRIQPLGPISSREATTRTNKSDDVGFGQLLNGLMQQAVKQQTVADNLSAQLALGEIDDVATVMIAAEKAALSWQLLQQVRNKLVEAFQEIMRMQV